MPNDNLTLFWVIFFQNLLDCFVFVRYGVQTCSGNGWLLLTTTLLDVGPKNCFNGQRTCFKKFHLQGITTAVPYSTDIWNLFIWHLKYWVKIHDGSCSPGFWSPGFYSNFTHKVGEITDSRLNFKEHILIKKKECSPRTYRNIIYEMIPKVTVRPYTSLVKSNLEYAAAVWKHGWKSVRAPLKKCKEGNKNWTMDRLSNI